MSSGGNRQDASNLTHAMTLAEYRKLDLKRPFTDRPMTTRNQHGTAPDTPSKGKDTRSGSLRGRGKVG